MRKIRLSKARHRGAGQAEVIVEKSVESTRRSQRIRSLDTEPIWPAEVMAEKSAESNHKRLAGRGVRGVSRSRGRVTKKRYVPDWSNIEVEGRMADGAMLARTSLMATGSWTSPGKQSTCAPILSDWLANGPQERSVRAWSCPMLRSLSECLAT